MEVLERILPFFSYAQENAASLAVVGVLLLCCIACQSLLAVYARSMPGGLVAIASLCTLISPLTLLVLGTRAALAEELQGLRGTSPSSGFAAAESVSRLSQQMTLTAPLVVVLLLLTGLVFSRVLTARGARTPEAYAPLVAAGALALLTTGIGFDASEVTAIVLPGHTFCGPVTYREFVAASVDEKRIFLEFVAIGFVVGLSLSVVWATFLCLSWKPTQASRNSVVLSAGLLLTSALMVAAAAPSMREARSGRLPFQRYGGDLESTVRTPQVRGPDTLHDGVHLRMSSNGFVVIGRGVVDGPEIAAAIGAMAEEAERFSFVPSHRELLQPVLSVEPELKGAAVVPALREVARRAAAVQLAFLEITTLERPVLGQLRARHESGVVLDLEPRAGSTAIIFGADETYDAFARRAAEARRAGPIHLSLSPE